jgi:hypothetical protein
MKIIELNHEEILAVSGGDAAATRSPGQNSWGESPESSEPSPVDCLLDNLKGFFTGRFRPDCP